MSNAFFGLSPEMSLGNERVATTAATISALLEKATYTQSVTPEQLVAELWSGIGIAAYDEQEKVAGYIAFRSLGFLTEAELVPGDEPLVETQVPLFGIGSLVADPIYQGNGLGDILINTALIEVRSRLLAAKVSASFALASAVVAPTSQRLFASNGFWPTDNAGITAAHGYGNGNPLPESKQVVNSIVIL